MQYCNKISLGRDRSLWPQTTLFEIVDAVAIITGTDDAKQIEDIVVNLCLQRQLRTTRTWARIQWVLSRETNPDSSDAKSTSA